MAESDLILLLQLIARKTDVGPLLGRGLRYTQISKLLEDALRDGLVERNKDAFAVTELGMAKMRASPSGEHPRRDGGWISPEEESRIESQGVTKVYLPKYRNSFFET